MRTTNAVATAAVLALLLSTEVMGQEVRPATAIAPKQSGLRLAQDEVFLTLEPTVISPQIAKLIRADASSSSEIGLGDLPNETV